MSNDKDIFAWQIELQRRRLRIARLEAKLKAKDACLAELEAENERLEVDVWILRSDHLAKDARITELEAKVVLLMGETELAKEERR